MNSSHTSNESSATPSSKQEFDLGGAPHFAPPRNIRQVMLDVLIALIPGILAHVWYFGPWILVQILLCILFALPIEAIMLKLRKQALYPFLSDGSAIVTAVLFALCMPQLAPWWVSFIGMLFAIAIAKHLYGGLGHNRFNPAMVAYVAVIIAYPQVMAQWLPPHPLLGGDDLLLQLDRQQPGFMQGMWSILTGQMAIDLQWDSITQATPLDTLRQGATQNLLINEIRVSPIFGDFGGLGWEWIANWYFVGGVWLLYRQVISWHVPVATLASIVLLTLPFYLMDPDAHPFPLQHVFSGGIMLGAFFIATDPVSGSSTPLGKIIFGIGFAIITLLIRRWSSYPDGVAFAVLCMNMLAPLIDRYTRPRIYGHER